MSLHATKLVPVKHRRGAAVTELAICLPVLLLLFLGSLECSNMVFLNQTLAVSSYEGARLAIQNGATSSEAIARAERLLTARNAMGGSVTINPTNIARLPSGTPIRVTVTAPCDANAILPQQFFNGRTLSATTTMIRE